MPFARLLWPLAVFLLPSAIFAQKAALRGSVADASGASLPGATVVLMSEKDSVMVAFALTDAAGKFTLKAAAPGSFILQTTYLGFEADWKKVDVQPGLAELDLGKTTLSANAATLKSVEIMGERDPMRLNRDTVEYNAAAYKTRPADAVEDLLKKLPGIEVERDGTVKAGGEKVQNVLVDGKEFFGKDTRLATKNLPADAVDRVQVFDKKSDMAEFTGIADGQDERTINLKLKPGKHAGHFGKADAGGGTDERFSGRANLNRFSPRTRISGIGLGNNVNEQGFSFDEYLDFMGGIGAFMSGGGRVEISDDEAGGLPIGDGSGIAGIQTTAAAGLNLTHDFSKGKELAASYFFNRLENNLRTDSRTDNFLPGGLFSNTDSGSRDSRNGSHRLNFSFKNSIDSFQRLTLRADAGLSDNFLRSRSAAETFGTDGFLENTNDRRYSADGSNWHARSSLTYRRRFRQPGRSVVASLSGKISDRGQAGRLFSEFSIPTSSAAPDTISQRQEADETNRELGLNLAWTEPLGRRQYLKFEASRQYSSNQNRKDFFDLAASGEVFNPLISNDFRRNLIADRAGAAYLLNRRGLNLTAAADFQNSRLVGSTDKLPEGIRANWSRLLPSLFLEKELRQQSRLTLNYTTDLREPALQRLQPVADNSDPLDVFTGNPNLKPEYVHEARLGWFKYDQFTFTTIFASLNGSFVKDKIQNSTTVDDLLRRSTSPVNTPGEWRVRGNFQFGTPIRPLRISTKIKLNSTLTSGQLFVNSEKNQVVRRRDAVDFSIENRRKQKIDALLGGRLAHNTARWSSSGNLNRDYTDTGIYSELAITPSDDWLLDSKFDCAFYSAATFGERAIVPLWQAGVTRYFLKNKKGRLRLSAVNLLNRDLGIRRSSELNAVRQERVNTVGRYFLLSFGYAISGFEKDAGGIQIKVED